MRKAFADEVGNMASNPDVVLLAGDIGYNLFDKFKENAPDRFYNCGIAEANMIGVAAGLAMSGMRPVVYTIASFATGRCYEQIKLDVGYHNLPVVIVGTGAGLSYASLGSTHHSLDDVGLMRLIPNMTVLAPCDPEEVRWALTSALLNDGPTYIRLGKAGEPNIQSQQETERWTEDKVQTLREGRDVCLISYGPIMSTVLAVAERLEKEGISTRVENFHTLKPLDTERLKELVLGYSPIAIIEEHSCVGGLGSAFAEYFLPRCGLNQILHFAVPDMFVAEVGTQEQARERLGLDEDTIFNKVLEAYDVY
jgi:transketolase